MVSAMYQLYELGKRGRKSSGSCRVSYFSGPSVTVFTHARRPRRDRPGGFHGCVWG